MSEENGIAGSGGTGVGERLRLARARRGVSQRDLAEASGISRQTIANAELRDSNLRRGTLQKLADALEIGVDDLLVGDEERERDRDVRAAGAAADAYIQAMSSPKRRPQNRDAIFGEILGRMTNR